MGMFPGMDVFSSSNVESLALTAALLLWWVALVHLTMAAGVRRGELVWSGKQPRLLNPELRVRSAISAVLLVASGWVLAEVTGLIASDLIPVRYTQSATFAVTAFLGVYFLYLVLQGSVWERTLFAPITLVGAILSGWLTFA